MNPLRNNQIGDPAARSIARSIARLIAPSAARSIARFAPRAHALWKRWRLRHPRSSLWLPQGAAALLVLLASSGVGWLLPCQAAKADLERMKRQEAALKQAYARQLQHAPRADLVQIGNRRARRRLALLEQQLTGPGEQEAVMNEIDAAGLARGLRFTLFKPEAEAGAGRRDRTAVQLRAVGSFQAIARFAGDIAKLPRIVILDPVRLQATGGDGASGLLTLQATANAFRTEYASQEEDGDDPLD